MATHLTQKLEIIHAFEMMGYKMSLGHILQHSWGYEFRARVSELRREGHVITYHRGKTPSEGVYVMTPPPDADGQFRMVI